MKTRILTGVISGALFLTVLLLPWSMALTIATAAITAVAVYEIFSVTNLLKYHGLESIALVFAALAPFFTRLSTAAALTTFGVYLALLAGTLFMYRKEAPIKKAVIVYALALFVTFALSSMAYLRGVSTVQDSDGLFYVILALLMAWGADTGAYFVGTFLGKHKLCPKLSPKKTVEGLFGGIATSLIVSVLAAVCYQTFFLKSGGHVSFGGVLLLAIVCAPLSVVGDLFASFIKRVYGAKDYGKLFPGHGGVMDRFDSLLFVFPVVYAVAAWFPPIR